MLKPSTPSGTSTAAYMVPIVPAIPARRVARWPVASVLAWRAARPACVPVRFSCCVLEQLFLRRQALSMHACWGSVLACNCRQAAAGDVS